MKHSFVCTLSNTFLYVRQKYHTPSKCAIYCFRKQIQNFLVCHILTITLTFISHNTCFIQRNILQQELIKNVNKRNLLNRQKTDGMVSCQHTFLLVIADGGICQSRTKPANGPLLYLLDYVTCLTKIHTIRTKGMDTSKAS